MKMASTWSEKKRLAARHVADPVLMHGRPQLDGWAEEMTLTAGTKLGSYEVVAEREIIGKPRTN